MTSSFRGGRFAHCATWTPYLAPNLEAVTGAHWPVGRGGALLQSVFHVVPLFHTVPGGRVESGDRGFQPLSYVVGWEKGPWERGFDGRVVLLENAR